jgi:hypothetical protein
MIFVHQDGRPLLLRQCKNGIANLVKSGPPQHRLIGSRSLIRHGFFTSRGPWLIERLVIPFDSFVPKPVQRRVHGNAIKPGGEACRSKVGATGSIYSQKDVLSQLFGYRLIANHPVDELNNRGSVQKQEAIEGGPVPGLHAQHQNGVSIFHLLSVYWAETMTEVKSEQRIVKNVKDFSTSRLEPAPGLRRVRRKPQLLLYFNNA